MSVYSSKPVTVERSAESLYEQFSDLSRFQEILDKLPEDQRAKIGEVHFGNDSLSIATPQVGEIKFVVKERHAPDRIVFGTAASPVPLALTANFKPLGPDSTEVSAVIDIEIPAIMRAFVGPKMQQAADQMGDLIGRLTKA